MSQFSLVGPGGVEQGVVTVILCWPGSQSLPESGALQVGHHLSETNGNGPPGESGCFTRERDSRRMRREGKTRKGQATEPQCWSS